MLSSLLHLVGLRPRVYYTLRGYSTQTHFLLRYYLQFIKRYVYLKSTKKKIKICATPQGCAPNVSKLYASCGIDISKCIEGGSMKLATQGDYIYIIM